MPRKARIIIPGSIHHVMSRGLDGEVIFHDNADREKFLLLLQRNLLRFKCTCYAWVLMDNHYHLLVRPLEPDLGVIMRRLNGGYARYFNVRHDRRGYLFQDRFKSLATQDLNYLRELIRYIHLNPLRAGIVNTLKKLESFQWSGHPAMLGLEHRDWHDADSALGRFGRSRAVARAAYVKYLEEGMDEEAFGWRFGNAADAKEEAHDDRLAGDRDFVLQALAKLPRTRSFREELRRIRPSLETLLAEVADTHDIDPAAALIRGWGRMNVRTIVRRAFCTKAKIKYDYSLKEIATFLGVDSSVVSRAVEE